MRGRASKKSRGSLTARQAHRRIQAVIEGAPKIMRRVTSLLWKFGRSTPVRRPIGWGIVAVVRVAGSRKAPWAANARRLVYDPRVARVLEGVQVTVKRLGLTFDLNLSDNLQRILYLAGTYEPDFLAFLESELSPGDVYIDVGAHIGLDAFVVARRLAGSGRVVCFEPSPDSAAAIGKGGLRNGLASVITIVKCGLGSEEGTLLLRAGPEYAEDDQGTRSRYNSGRVVVEAPLCRFDDWAAATHLDRMDVVKLDVEGCEYDALAGMEKSLRSLRPRSVVVEVNEYRMRQADISAEMLDNLLSGFGYSHARLIFPENVVYRPRSGAEAVIG